MAARESHRGVVVGAVWEHALLEALVTLEVADLLEVALVLLVLVQGSLRSVGFSTGADETTIDLVGGATDTFLRPLVRVAILARFLLQVRAFVGVLPACLARGEVTAFLAVDLPTLVLDKGRASCGCK